MSVREGLVTEFSKLVIEELKASNIPGTPENHLHVITTWCEVYDDVPARNRAELAVRDALEELRDRVTLRIKRPASI